MTIKEMQKAVLQKLDVIDSNIYVASEDIELAINDAIDMFIKSKFETRLNEIGLGFEQSQIRIDDLRELVEKTNGLDTEEVEVPFSDNIFIDKSSLPSDYRHLVNVSAKVQYNADGVEYTTTGNKRVITGEENIDYVEGKVRCSFSQLDDIQSLMSDPFGKTMVKKPIYTVNGKNIYIYTDKTFIVDKIYLTYLRQPTKVSLASSTDCDLAESTHVDIVNMAVRIIATQKGATQAPESNDS